MKKIIFTLLFTGLAFTGYSQGNNPFDASNSNTNQVTTKPMVVTDYEGSPYLEDQFTPGLIVEEGNKSQTVYIRYNVVDDQVELKVAPSQKDIYLLPRQQKFSYKLKDYSYTLSAYNVEDLGLIKGYVQTYYASDKIVFIGKPLAQVIPGQAAKTGYDKAKPATIDIATNFYIGKPNEQLKEVRIKEKDFEKILGDKKGMKDYFDDNKIKTTDDVIKMLKFYDSKN